MRIDTKKIERERLRLGLNKSQFTRKVGISRQLYYAFLKTKRIRLSTLEKIGNGLDWDPKDLLISR